MGYKLNMKYKKGDKVLIREWEDMEKDYGSDEYGNINCYPGMTKPMKKYCGTVQEIAEVNKLSYGMKGMKWRFSDGMIEKKVGEEIDRWALKDYVNMPRVEVNGRVFVDKKIFVEYVYRLLEQDLDDCMNDDEKSGIEMAMIRLNGI